MKDKYVLVGHAQEMMIIIHFLSQCKNYFPIGLIFFSSAATFYHSPFPYFPRP